MARVHIFSDEAGDFTFRHSDGASEYFIIATVTMGDCKLGDDLQALQRELAWSGVVLESFHAVMDRAHVRTRVFNLIASSNVRIDATVLHKCKTQPAVAADHVYLYKLANYLHFKYVIPRVVQPTDELMVVASSLQIKKKRQAVSQSVEDVVAQVTPTTRTVVAFIRNDTDPCLQLADYAAWAIQRKIERGDDAWFNMISHRVRSVFEPFANSATTYY